MENSNKNMYTHVAITCDPPPLPTLKTTVWKNQHSASTNSLHNLGNRSTNKSKSDLRQIAFLNISIITYSKKYNIDANLNLHSVRVILDL